MVLHLVPLGGGHRGEETLHFLGIGDQLAVEVARVPVEQDTAHIEDRDRRRFRGCFCGQSETFPAAVGRDNLANKINWLKTSTQSVFCWCSGASLVGCRLVRSEEHTSELQSQSNLVCRLLLEKKRN